MPNEDKAQAAFNNFVQLWTAGRRAPVATTSSASIPNFRSNGSTSTSTEPPLRGRTSLGGGAVAAHEVPSVASGLIEFSVKRPHDPFGTERKDFGGDATQRVEFVLVDPHLLGAVIRS